MYKSLENSYSPTPIGSFSPLSHLSFCVCVCSWRMIGKLQTLEAIAMADLSEAYSPVSTPASSSSTTHPHHHQQQASDSTMLRSIDDAVVEEEEEEEVEERQEKPTTRVQLGADAGVLDDDDDDDDHTAANKEQLQQQSAATAYTPAQQALSDVILESKNTNEVEEISDESLRFLFYFSFVRSFFVSTDPIPHTPHLLHRRIRSDYQRLPEHIKIDVMNLKFRLIELVSSSVIDFSLSFVISLLTARATNNRKRWWRNARFSANKATTNSSVRFWCSMCKNELRCQWIGWVCHHNKAATVFRLRHNRQNSISFLRRKRRMLFLFLPQCNKTHRHRRPALRATLRCCQPPRILITPPLRPLHRRR